MAHSLAYGDSATYWRVQAADDAHASQLAYALQQQAAIGGSQLNSAMARQLLNPYNAFANVYPPQKSIAAREQSTTNRVIADQGFGGAESRPRSRRYRKEPLRLPDVDAT